MIAEPNSIWTGDSLALVSQLQASQLDCIYIDPPFGTGIVRKGRGTSYQDVDGDPTEFVAWLRPWLVHSHRLLRNTGSLFVHLDYRTIHYIKVALDEVFGRENFVNEIIWCYSVGGKGKRSFAKKHDTILWYAKTSKWAFYPEQVAVNRKGGSHMKVVVDANGERIQQKVNRKTGKVYSYPIAAGKIPEDWWCDIETLNHSDRQRVGWPTQKPIKLLERILCAVTKPGDCVADWFAGSGTTAVAAAGQLRNFVVCDQLRDATKLIESRVRSLRPDLTVAVRTVGADSSKAKKISG